MQAELFTCLVDACLALLYDGAAGGRRSARSRRAAAHFLAMAYLCLSLEARRHAGPAYRTLRRWVLEDADGARQAFYHLALMRMLL